MNTPFGRYIPRLAAASGLINANPHASNEEITIPINIEPFTFFLLKTAVTTKPIQVIIIAGLKSPISINVDSFATTKPQFFKPINAMNNPIPPETANFKFFGIALTTASRTLKSDKIINIIPSTNTAVNAICQLTPIPITTV